MIGRFISADSEVPDHLIPQSLNRYSYCLNNPIIYIDPSGHSPEEGEKWGTDNDYKKWAQRSNPERFRQLNSGRLEGAGEMNPALDAIAEEIATAILTGGMSLFNSPVKSGLEDVAEVSFNKMLNALKKKAKELKGGKWVEADSRTLKPLNKKPKSGLSKKEGATDIPSFVKEHPEGVPYKNEKGTEFAERMMNHQYPDGWSRKGLQGDQYSEIKKWSDRHFKNWK